MSDLQEYLTLLAKVRADAQLSAMITEYESSVTALNTLLSDPEYDAQEAIRLTNDIEYLSMMIERNDLYRQFNRARTSVQEALKDRAEHFCGCNCAQCQSKCSTRRTYEENA